MKIFLILIVSFFLIILLSITVFAYFFDYEIQLSRKKDHEVLELFFKEIKKSDDDSKIKALYLHIQLREIMNDEVLNAYQKYIKSR